VFNGTTHFRKNAGIRTTKKVPHLDQMKGVEANPYSEVASRSR
jgi:hypothetical protein